MSFSFHPLTFSIDIGERPTKTDIITTIRAVSRWKNLADVYGIRENKEKGEEMLAELQRLLESVGVKVDKVKTRAKKCTAYLFSLTKINYVTTSALFKERPGLQQLIATEDDLAEIQGKYDEYFAIHDDDEGACGDLYSQRLSFDLRDVQTGDLGMEVEATVPPNLLSSSVGFVKQCLPILFQTHRHTAGFNAWDRRTKSQVKDMKPISLHWHQLAGVHSIIRNTFTSDCEPDHATGMLICDEVGLGKTAQTIATIAFLNQVIDLSAQNKKPPPHLE
jgi:SNF2 family DNA or RNA helicase